MYNDSEEPIIDMMDGETQVEEKFEVEGVIEIIELDLKEKLEKIKSEY